MKTANQSPLQFNKVLDKITEIIEKVKGENYIYRGESELYPHVCSGLYRAYLRLEIRDPAEAVMESRERIIDKAKHFFAENDFHDSGLLNMRFKASLTRDEDDNFEILAQLQHYGCQTNLIDFTTDYLVALYFACAHSQKKPGRVICLKTGEDENGKFCVNNKNEKYRVRRMFTTVMRAALQKSRFVETRNGLIEVDEVDTILIPESLKGDIRNYLEVYHDISTCNIYGDIHGFIQGLDIYPLDYRELHNGKTYEDNGDLSKNKNEKKDFYKKAIECYQRASQQDKVRFEAYCRIGKVHTKLEEFCDAIHNYKRAVKADIENALGYHHLGVTYSLIGSCYYQKEEYDKAHKYYGEAIDHYTRAIKLDPCNVKSYIDRGNIHRTLKNNEQAIENYKQALLQDSPDFLMVVRDLSVQLLKCERQEDLYELLKCVADVDRDKRIESVETIVSILSASHVDGSVDKRDKLHRWLKQ